MSDTVGTKGGSDSAIGHHNESLHAGDHGSGNVVVLLHAFPLDSRIWEPVTATLAATHRIITPDFRGFGRSHTDAWPTTLEEHADDVAGLLRQRGVARATFVGLSMGGYVALALMRRHPQLIARLALVDARAAGDSPESRSARDQNIAVVEQQGVPALLERMLPKLLSSAASDELRRTVRRMGSEQPSAAVRAALLAMRDRADASDVLSAVTVPTAVIVGDADALFAVDEARQMAALTRFAELSVIEGAGHLSPCEAPARFTAALARLLQRPD